MAPSPTTIPTSFVPKQPVRSGSSYSRSGHNLFLTISLIILGISLAAAGVTFGYQRYLIGSQASKALEVKAAEESVSSETVEGFIRTRNRFVASKTLLENHVAPSQFFALLESVTLEGVRFESLSFTLAADGSADIQMEGVARTFNALAAESSAFAAEKKIKRAIFSGISVNEARNVDFTLEADLDPRLLSFKNLPIPNAPVDAVESSAEVAPEEAATTTPPSL